MGSLIATIFTVVVLAISTFVVSNPNFNFDNRSIAMMTEGGGGNIPKPKATANAQIGNQSIAHPTSYHPPVPTRSIVTATPTQAAASPPSNSEDAAAIRAERKECQISGGSWTNGNCDDPASTVSYPKTTNPTTVVTASPPSNSEDAAAIRAERKECQISGGSWTNGNCDDPASTVSYPKTTNPTTVVTASPPSNSEDAAAIRAERKECVINGGTWSNDKCVVPTATISPQKAIPTPTSTPTPSATSCDGKPEGTQICNSGGGYNYCKVGHWYSKKCEIGETCSSGSCTKVATQTIYSCETYPSCGSGARLKTGVSINGTITFSYQCCNSGEVCDSSQGKCTPSTKKDLGAICGTDDDCNSGHCWGTNTYAPPQGNAIVGQLLTTGVRTCRSTSQTEEAAKVIAPMVVDAVIPVKAIERCGTSSTLSADCLALLALPELQPGLQAISDAVSYSLTGIRAARANSISSSLDSLSDSGASLAPKNIDQQGAIATILNSENNTLLTNSTDEVVKTLENKPETITLYHGSAFQNHESIMENGIYGVGNGIIPTFSDDIRIPTEFASGKGLSASGRSVANKVQGGYVYQVEVPVNKVTYDGPGIFDNESYFTLSLDNPTRPGAPYDTWKTLEPQYIKKVFRVNNLGEIIEVVEP